MRISWRSEWPNWALLAGMFLVAALAWPSAPDRFPVHWNWAGQIDRHGGRAEGLLFLPVITLGIYLLLIFLPKIDPGRANYERFKGAYSVFRLVLTVSMSLLYAVMLLSAWGYPVDMSLLVPMLVGGMLIVIGSVMGKIRPNWFVGIRTPWTLTSKKSWLKTHRLGGWLFIVSGVALFLAGVVRTQWAMMAVSVWFAVFVVWVFAYSYLVWRTDPERTSFWRGNSNGA